MSWLTRTATLLRADAHGVVDALEDKALMLRQHVREAAAELGRKRCHVEALDAGVDKVHFINGRVPHTLLLEIFTQQGSGTEIIH